MQDLQDIEDISRHGVRTLERLSHKRQFCRGDQVGIVGHGVAQLWTPSVLRPGKLILAQEVEFENLVTQVGDQYYGERAAGIGSPPNQVTGMRLGTGSTAVAKTGAGAAIVTYTTASQVAIAGGFPTSSIPGSARRIQWQALWGAGVATASGLNEVVITNETPITNVAGSAANTISRALLSPVVNKGASDTLTITWNHDLLGA
jgi:hypothetical protein